MADVSISATERDDFTTEQAEEIFQQVMTCEPLLAVEDVDQFLAALYGQDAQRKRRAIAVFATKGGEFYRGVSEDRDKAVAVAMVAMLAENDAKFFRGVAELLETLHTRTEVALCNYLDMDAIKAEAEAMLSDDEAEAAHA